MRGVWNFECYVRKLCGCYFSYLYEKPLLYQICLQRNLIDTCLLNIKLIKQQARKCMIRRETKLERGGILSTVIILVAVFCGAVFSGR